MVFDNQTSTSSTSSTNDESNFACPICWATTDEVKSQGIPLALTPCHHTACLTCIENVLLVRTDIPCYGTCPMCRADVCLFDLMVEMDEGCDCDDDDDDEDAEFYEKRWFQSYQKAMESSDECLQDSVLSGRTLYTREGGIGAYSIHFPTDSCSNSIVNDSCSANKDDSPCRPYVSCTALYHEKMDDGSALPDILYFENGYHWHSRSKTFHGRISWKDSSGGALFRGSDNWDIILQVSSDVRYICGGGILKHRVKHFPLDGKWMIIWKDTGTRADIEIDNGSFTVFGDIYQILLDEHSLPFFLWPGNQVKQEALSGINLGLEPDGPPVDGTIVWKHNDESTGEIIWQRRSISKCQTIKTYFGGEKLDRTTYLIRDNENPLRNSSGTTRYVPEALWGNMFYQVGKFGVASYHFISESGNGLNGAYISYESPECAVWPPLDDGSPVPSRVPFTNISWDPELRIFRGKIEWQHKYGSTWQGDALWEYEMKFCPDYLAIVAGYVKSSYSSNANFLQVKNEFGRSLVYINGRSSEKILSVMSRDEAKNIFLQVFASHSLDSIDIPILRQMIEHGASLQHILLILHTVM